MDQEKEAQEPDKTRKRKALQEELNVAKNKPMGIKLSPLKTSFLAAVQVWTKIANTHPNKCKHPPSHSKLLVAKV